MKWLNDRTFHVAFDAIKAINYLRSGVANGGNGRAAKQGDKSPATSEHEQQQPSQQEEMQTDT
jgi:hypothetical protein